MLLCRVICTVGLSENVCFASKVRPGLGFRYDARILTRSCSSCAPECQRLRVSHLGALQIDCEYFLNFRISWSDDVLFSKQEIGNRGMAIRVFEN